MQTSIIQLRNELLNFYSKEDLSAGGFQCLVEELCDTGLCYKESVSLIKEFFNLKKG